MTRLIVEPRTNPAKTNRMKRLLFSNDSQMGSAAPDSAADIFGRAVFARGALVTWPSSILTAANPAAWRSYQLRSAQGNQLRPSVGFRICVPCAPYLTGSRDRPQREERIPS